MGNGLIVKRIRAKRTRFFIQAPVVTFSSEVVGILGRVTHCLELQKFILSIKVIGILALEFVERMLPFLLRWEGQDRDPSQPVLTLASFLTFALLLVPTEGLTCRACNDTTATTQVKSCDKPSILGNDTALPEEECAAGIEACVWRYHPHKSLSLRGCAEPGEQECSKKAFRHYCVKVSEWSGATKTKRGVKFLNCYERKKETKKEEVGKNNVTNADDTSATTPTPIINTTTMTTVKTNFGKVRIAFDCFCTGKNCNNWEEFVSDPHRAAGQSVNGPPSWKQRRRSLLLALSVVLQFIL